MSDRCVDNLLNDVAAGGGQEAFAQILATPEVRIERIVSHGSHAADWYDQGWDEWVLVVEGAARLLIEGRGEICLSRGGHALLPAHVRHRVLWSEDPTVWLAVHLGGGLS